jgi:hypothetical protein
MRDLYPRGGGGKGCAGHGPSPPTSTSASLLRSGIELKPSCPHGLIIGERKRRRSSHRRAEATPFYRTAKPGDESALDCFRLRVRRLRRTPSAAHRIAKTQRFDAAFLLVRPADRTVVSVEVETGIRLLEPDVVCGAGRSRMSAGRALVPFNGACLPAVHDACTIDGAVTAGAASICRIGRSDAKTGREQHRRY